MAENLHEFVATSSRHTTFYLAAGVRGVPIVFLHGWPELSRTWRRQLHVFGALGFRAVAPDLRGYGRSSIYERHEDYRLELAVADMLELLDALGAEKAVWVGHDWGAPVAWSIAQHHPERCHGVAALTVPYIPEGFAPANLIPLADRSIYPEDAFPAAQWDYQLAYEESFAETVAFFEKDVRATVRAIFTAGDPSDVGKPAGTAFVRARGRRIPELERDPRVLSEADENAYTTALRLTGFVGPCSWYMNAEANVAYALVAKDSWHLTMPVLFVHAAFDAVCDTLTSRLAEPMRLHCRNLTEVVARSGHSVAQEEPSLVNAAIATWLANELPAVWESTSAVTRGPSADGARSSAHPGAGC